MSHFDLRRFKAISDLPSRIFLYTLAAFDYFFSYFNLIVYPSDILPCSQNWAETRREWQFWLEEKLMMVWGRRWGSFRKLTFLFSSSLGLHGLKKNWIPTVNTLKQLNLIMIKRYYVSFGKRKGTKSRTWNRKRGFFVFFIGVVTFQLTDSLLLLPIWICYCIIPLCWFTFYIHSGIIPVGQFSRKCAKSINQAQSFQLIAWLTVSQL